MFNKRETAVLQAALAKAKHTYNVVSDYADGDHIEDGGLTVREVLELLTMAIAMPQLEADIGTPFKEQSTPTRIVLTLNVTKEMAK